MRAAIASIVAFLILAAKYIFNIEISDELGGQITDLAVTIITAGTTLYGIVKGIIKLRKRTQAK